MHDVVLDTNVVVSGLLSPNGPPGRLVDMLLARTMRLTLDDRVEHEYRNVLSRPRFKFEPERLEAFLAILQFQHHVVATPWQNPPSPDPDDVVFLEVAMESGQRLLVTGNTRHFPKRCRGPITVLSPTEAWSNFMSGT